MKIDEYLKIKDEVYQKARALSVSKGEDYSGKEDTLKNLKLAELMGLCSAEAGILVRLSDKLMRLVGFVHNGNFSVQDEKLLDTVVDVHNYIDLFYAVVKEKSEGTNDIINQMEESTKQAKEWLKRRMLEEMSVKEIKKRLEEAGYEIGKVPLPEDVEFSRYKDKLRAALGRVLLTEFVGATIVDKNHDDRKAMLLHRLTTAMIDVMGCAK